VIIDRGAEPYFIFYEIDKLRPFILSCDPRLKKPAHLIVDVGHIEKEKEGHFLVDLKYESDIGTVTGLQIWEALQGGRRYLFSEAGLILLKQSRFNWIKGLAKKRWLKKGEQVALTSVEWIRLFIFEEIAPPQDQESLKIFEEFKQFQTHEALNIEGLQSQLRFYQETGLKWLWFLYCHGLSGLLCDEMGLGKTHQAMALLQAAKNKNPSGKFLVVCPTSVIYHWQELLKRFLPDLRICIFYGIQRTLTNFESHFDLLLTSYGTLRSEKSPLSAIFFDIAIFDETQIAKNAHSQTHKALKLIQARTRIGLTGTPIENRLLELKSLFDVIIPGYMPTDAIFKEMFINPIEKQQDHEKKSLLTRFIHPFILRRKKSEVLLELPEKTEEIAYSVLSDEQKELYRKTYLSLRTPLLKDLHDQDKNVPYMHIFSLLSKLKQICNHPALATGDVDNYKAHASGKWDLFVELLGEARESGQKLVVFSQYLGMLDIIQKYLEEEGIGYATIRGATRDRKSQIEKFRDDPACEVFVGSLQAAGVGIDLIAASVVIHYDRWWNPAKENQATDRVHRIGQNRGVQVFKMVTKGTIEEHIQRLIEKKSGLMEEIIGYDDQDQIKGLDREELVQLIRLMEIDLKI
jgi:SNF2 family DNA or RNA helicase